ncbi:MAG: hypothetical protein WCP55_10730 [Lentisphaerota bacterium]
MKMKTLMCVASLSCSTVWAAEVNVIANSDFEKVDANNVVSNWKSSAKIEVLNEKVDGNEVLRVYATIKSSNNIYWGSVDQKLPDLTAGKYILSGEFKGDLSGLNLVVRNTSGFKFAKWIPAYLFVKSEKEGWYIFSENLEVPSDVKDGQIVIETYQKKEDDQYTDLNSIKLIKQKDKKNGGF